MEGKGAVGRSGHPLLSAMISVKLFVCLFPSVLYSLHYTVYNKTTSKTSLKSHCVFSRIWAYTINSAMAHSKGQMKPYETNKSLNFQTQEGYNMNSVLCPYTCTALTSSLLWLKICGLQTVLFHCGGH